MRKDDVKRYPKVRVDDEALFIALKLAEAGYYGGDPMKVLEAPVDIVLEILRFKTFQKDWEAVFDMLNNPI